MPVMVRTQTRERLQWWNEKGTRTINILHFVNDSKFNFLQGALVQPAFKIVGVPPKV